VSAGSRTIILDAGTGICSLGKERPILDADILLSHTHLDHIIGFPFFRPLYNPKNSIRVWAANLKLHNGLKQVLGAMISPPLFPLVLDDLKARIIFNDFKAGLQLEGDTFSESGIDVQTLELNHPDKATAYRINYKGRSVCYVTDVEQDNGLQDNKIIEFIRDTDLFIYDSTYSDDDYHKFKGWGHSTWQQGVKLAQAANARQFAAFHHDPDADDKKLDERALQISRIMPNAFIAKEGMVVDLLLPAK